MIEIEHFTNIKLPKLRSTFECLRPHLITKFEEYLDHRRTSTRGRKRMLNLEIFFKAFYSTVKDGTSSTNFKYYFGLPKSTYSYYLNLLKSSKILESLNDVILCSYPDVSTLLGDSFTVKSHKGIEGVGRNPTDRGRNGIKVQVISDEKGVIKSLVTAPANDHDSKIFSTSLPSITIDGKGREILLDSAYIGEKVNQAATAKQLCPIVVPKRTRGGGYTHILTPYATEKIKKRWKVEQHIGIIRTNKGISNKYTTSLNTYKLYLEFIKLLINSYIIYIV